MSRVGGPSYVTRCVRVASSLAAAQLTPGLTGPPYNSHWEFQARGQLSVVLRLAHDIGIQASTRLNCTPVNPRGAIPTPCAARR